MTTSHTVERNAQRLLACGQCCSALLLTDILCEQDPQSLDYQLLRVQCLFELREFENVLRACRAILSSDEQNPRAIELGMKAAFELGEIKCCAQFAEKLRLVLSDSSNVNSFCYLAKCAELCGETDKAVSNYKCALQKDPFCGEALDALVERRLADLSDLNSFVDSLEFSPSAEVVRRSYKAKIGYIPTAENECVPQRLLLLQQAREEYAKNNLRQSLTLTTELLEHNPFSRAAVCLHLSILVDLKATPKLFEHAHFLSKSKSWSELAVYAIGCFYFSLSNFERAGRYFSRATELDSYFSEAWVAYGHCYAKLEEGEQALNVYRRAIKFFPGLFSCYTFSGMQYSRNHQWSLALCSFEESLKNNRLDPLVLNEMGVLFTRTQKLSEALYYFRQAYENVPNKENPSEYTDCIIFNLATVLRRMGEYSEALQYYQQYVKCRPKSSHGHCALGFTLHLAGKTKEAIAHYHTALTIKHDSFCKDMLDRALAVEFDRDVGGIQWVSDNQAS